MNWKTLAIILIIIQIIEIIWIGFGYYLLVKEENMAKECYYTTCAEYPEAYIDEDICTCYDYDVLGNLVVAKTKVLK